MKREVDFVAWYTWLVVTGVVVFVPLVLPTYPRFVMSLILVNAIAAMGVNLSMGYAGLVSVGHAGFAAVGAYTTAILMSTFNVSYWLTVPIAAVLAGALGVLVGVPALRLNPLYISMVTFGFGQAINSLAVNWVRLTNGPNGISVPPVELVGYMFSPHTFYYVVAVLFLTLLWLSANMVHSRLGRALIAVRTSELAAQAMGVHLGKYKTIAFALGACYGSVSGSLYAGLSEFVNPDAFVFQISIMYLTMNVVGGMGTVTGPVVGAVIFTVLPELLRPAAEYREFFSGGLLLVFLVFVQDGIVGTVGELVRRTVRWRPT